MLPQVQAQDDGETFVQHGIDPARRPSEPQSGDADGGEAIRVGLLHDPAETLQLFRHREIDVQADTAGPDRERQQRPRPAHSKLDQTRGDGLIHPSAQVGVLGEEGTSDPLPVPMSAVGQLKPLTVREVCREQLGVLTGDRHRRSGRRRRNRVHRSVSRLARAAAYSAARCSMDRCTYLLVVSGLA